MKTGGPENRLTRLSVVFFIGFFILVAQTLLFRDFLAVYEGNELGFGCFFGAWLLWVGVGAWGAKRPGRFMDRLTDRFDLLALLYVPFFIFQQQLILGSRAMAGVQPFEHFEFLRMFPVSILANAPLSFLTGFLFTRACGWVSRDHALPVARVYMAESLGSFAGGLAATLLLARGISSESLFLSASGLLLLAVGLNRGRSRIGLVLLACAVVLAGSVGFRLDRPWKRFNELRAWQRLLPATAFRDSFTTPQARYLFGEYKGQFNVLSCESVTETVPNDERASEIMALSLAQNPAARRILVFGADTYSMCRRWQSLPQVESVCWIHPDPDYPGKLLSALPPALKSGNDKLFVPSRDLREYLASSGGRHDLVLLNVPDAATLFLNRYLTLELFRQIKACLTENGVVGVRVSGGENFMGDERVNLGAVVYATLKTVFSHLALKPGDETWLLASDGNGLSEKAEVLRRRFQSVPGAASLYPPEGLSVLYPADRIDYQRRKYDEIMARTKPALLLNSDSQPKSVLLSLLLVARLSGLSGDWVDLLRRLILCGTPIALLGILMYPLLRWIYLSQNSLQAGSAERRMDVHVLVTAVGFAGMSFSLLLMFLYQSRFGAIFLNVGLFSSLFMLGLFLGSLLCNAVLRKLGREPRWLLPAFVVAQLILYALALAVSVRYIAFIGLFLLSGALGGVFIPLAAFRLKRAGLQDVAAGSQVEAFDHLGGTLGSLATGWILLPLLGAAALPVILGGVMLANIPACFRFKQTGQRSRLDRWIHSAGYGLFGLCVVLMFASVIVRSTSSTMAANPLTAVARDWLAAEKIEEHRVGGDGKKTSLYFSAPKTDSGGRVFLFNSADWSAGIPGHGGPVPLAIMTDEKGMLLNFRVLSSSETPSYMRRTLAWQKQLIGRNIFSDQGLAGVDAVSGATQTSRAILDALRQSGRAFYNCALEKAGVERGFRPARFVPDKESAVLLVFLAGALFLRFRPSPWARRAFLLTVLLVCGFWLNLQYSLAEVLTVFSLHIPDVACSAAFLLVVALPVLALFIGNVYCGYLCPFGALQELIGDLRPKWIRLNPDKGAWRYARIFKFVLLAVFTVEFAIAFDQSLFAKDPLVSVFGKEMERGLSVFVLLLLVLSFFYDRFWCRNLCPAGAFLGLLGRAKLLRAFMPRIFPARCPYGVRSARDMDCLDCDRCRVSSPPAESDSTGRSAVRNMLFFLCVAVCGFFFVSHAIPSARVVPPAAPGAAVVRELPVSSGKARDLDIDRIRWLIERRKLSGHEAMYYSPVEQKESDHEQTAP